MTAIPICPHQDDCAERRACRGRCPDLTEEEAAYAATLPTGVIYIPTKAGGHNSREFNEAYRRVSDETNARWRAMQELPGTT